MIYWCNCTLNVWWVHEAAGIAGRDILPAQTLHLVVVRLLLIQPLPVLGLSVLLAVLPALSIQLWRYFLINELRNALDLLCCLEALAWLLSVWLHLSDLLCMQDLVIIVLLYSLKCVVLLLVVNALAYILRMILSSPVLIVHVLANVALFFITSSLVHLGLAQCHFEVLRCLHVLQVMSLWRADWPLCWQWNLVLHLS